MRPTSARVRGLPVGVEPAASGPVRRAVAGGVTRAATIAAATALARLAEVAGLSVLSSLSQ